MTLENGLGIKDDLEAGRTVAEGIREKTGEDQAKEFNGHISALDGIITTLPDSGVDGKNEFNTQLNNKLGENGASFGNGKLIIGNSGLEGDEIVNGKNELDDKFTGTDNDQEVQSIISDATFVERFPGIKDDPEKLQVTEGLIQLALESGIDPTEFLEENMQYIDDPEKLHQLVAELNSNAKPTGEIGPDGKPVLEKFNNTDAFLSKFKQSNANGGSVEGRSCSSYNQLEGECKGKTTPDQLIAGAKEFIGTPYKWGGLSKQGIDCSGLVSCGLQKSGVFPNGFRTIADGFRKGLCTETQPNSVQKGDLVFYKGESKNGTDTTHVMIATGPASGGKIPIIDASSGKGCVSERTIPITGKVVAGKPKFYGNSVS